MSEKKKKLLTACALIVIFASIGCVAAYLVWVTGHQNKLKIGQGDASIAETFDPPKKLSIGENIYQKLITVQNGGKNPCFVRVFMDFTDMAVRESEGIKTYFFKPKTKDADGNLIIPATAPDKDNPANGTWVEASKWTPDEGWEYIGDDEGGLAGFYYYKNPVESGDSTPPLISWVRTDYTAENNITDYQILVYSETVQVVEIDNSGTKYTSESYRTAWENYLRVPPFVVLKANVPEGKTVYNNENYNADTNSVNPDSFKGMFKGNNTLTSVNLDISLQSTDSEGTVHKVSSMQEMFRDCTALEEITLKADDFSSVKNFKDMFSGCTNLKTITLENKNGTADIDISELFKELPNLESITLKGFNITNAESAFEGTTNAINFDFANSRITGSAKNMFKGCSWVTELPIADHSGITDTTGMYQGTELTGSVSISDMSSSNSAENMFSGCNGITSLSVANAQNVENINGMIDGISTLQAISLTQFDNASFSDGFLSANADTLEMIKIEANLSELSTFRSILTGNSNTGIAANTKITTLELNNKATNGESSIGNEGDMFNGWTNLQTVKLDNFKNSSAVSFNNLFRGNKDSLSYVRITGCKVNNISEMFRETFRNSTPTTLSLELDLSEVTASGNLFQDSNNVTNNQVIEMIRGCSFSSDNSLINNGGMNIWKDLGNTGKWYRCANGWVYVYTYLIKAFDPSETEPTYTPS